MSVRRLEHIRGFHIDRVAAAAGEPRHRHRAARSGNGGDPGGDRRGRGEQLAAVHRPRRPQGGRGAYIERRGGPRYDGRREIVITCGEGDAMLDALFCLTDPGDEVLLTDPTYAGRLNRVRLVGRCRGLSRSRSATGRGDSMWARRRWTSAWSPGVSAGWWHRVTSSMTSRVSRSTTGWCRAGSPRSARVSP